MINVAVIDRASRVIDANGQAFLADRYLVTSRDGEEVVSEAEAVVDKALLAVDPLAAVRTIAAVAFDMGRLDHTFRSVVCRPSIPLGGIPAVVGQGG